MSTPMLSLLFWATIETLYMVFAAGLIATIIGLPLGLILFGTRNTSLGKNRLINTPLELIVNVVRSIPFIILLILLLPLTRLIVGTSIGTTAAIVPLAIGAIPFFARITENAIAEIPFGLIEAGLAMGATQRQILWKILLPEAIPSLIQGVSLMLITLVGYSAMAGAVGGGGLGSVAINYGYQRFDWHVMLQTVLILIIIVYTIQFFGALITKRLTR